MHIPTSAAAAALAEGVHRYHSRTIAQGRHAPPQHQSHPTFEITAILAYATLHGEECPLLDALATWTWPSGGADLMNLMVSPGIPARSHRLAVGPQPKTCGSRTSCNSACR